MIKNMTLKTCYHDIISKPSQTKHLQIVTKTVTKTFD